MTAETKEKTLGLIKEATQFFLYLAGALLGAYIFMDSRLDAMEAAQVERERVAIARMTAIELEVREIKTDRFTTKNGLELWHQIADIRQHLALLPSQDPPPWLVNSLRGLEVRLDRVTDRLDRLDRKIGD